MIDNFQQVWRQNRELSDQADYLGFFERQLRSNTSTVCIRERQVVPPAPSGSNRCTKKCLHKMPHYRAQAGANEMSGGTSTGTLKEGMGVRRYVVKKAYVTQR